jgi:HEAT repeat protein
MLKTRPRDRRDNVRRRMLGGALAFGLCIAFAGISRVGAQSGDDQSVATKFGDFLHFSVLGRFDIADARAKELLAHPDLDPVELLKLAKESETSVDTLITLINHSSISESARKILDVIREGEHILRQDSDRIRENIENLGGTPQNEFFAVRALADSGEYAIPWMVQTLRDDEKRSLWPRVIRALPKIGGGAVNPLVQALGVADERIRQRIIFALGELGYARAIPYLQHLTIRDDVSPESKSAAIAAMAHIEQRLGRSFELSAERQYVDLGNQYYDEHGSVRADTRLDKANVWYWDPDTQFLKAIAVPREIFGAVMAMRVCERALHIDPDRAEAVALWLAANVRREARLGLDTESDDTTEQGTVDPTRPEGFPRALYFTSTAGARYAHLVLDRAVADRDAPVALGAIAALMRIAGPSSLIGGEDYKQPLVAALRFPDLAVRIRAALALGNALPRRPFRGSEYVVPLLGQAIAQTGRMNLLIVDPDADNLNRLLGVMRDADTGVVGERNVLVAMERVRSELESLSGILIASDVVGPEADDAIVQLRGQFDTSSTPIVLMVKPGQEVAAEMVAESDAGVETADASADRDVLLAKLRLAADRVGQTPVGSDLALELALEAGRALHRIARDGRTVLEAEVAVDSVVAALGSVHPELQTVAIDVLSLLSSSEAQKAVARVALDEDATESLRLTAFEGLGTSAKLIGNRLTDGEAEVLLRIAFDEANLRLRTAAGHALGALNLPAAKASQPILKFHRD